MQVIDTHPHRAVIWWLISGVALIMAMVVVGGITRLTDSGLSMVDWRLFMGSIPPLNEQQWLGTFAKYQTSPEFKQLNSDFSLADFKRIFFWEYFHRLLGRFLGIVFIVPFAIFLWRRKIPKELIPKLVLIFGLGAFQAFLGWFMVKSGLVNEPRVSHFRLAAHLLTAFLTMCYIFWVILGLIRPRPEAQVPARLSKMVWLLLGVLILQIIYGAFVAGRDAGHIHTYFPHMNPGQFISPAAFGMDSFFDNILLNSSGIQFIHRYLAYIVVGLVIFIWLQSRKASVAATGIQKQAMTYVLAAVTFQFLLGVFTLVLSVPLALGVLHQFGALILLSTVIYARFTLRKA